MLRRNARDADLTSSDFDRLQRLFDDACELQAEIWQRG